MHKVRCERARVAKLVTAGLYGQRHRQVVALCKAEQQVLHGGASCFVGLQENHVGVFRLQARGGVRAQGWTTKVEGFHGPGGKKNNNLFEATLAQRLQRVQFLHNIRQR